ncbi:MAG: Ig-like domain-containing protein, partial [Bacteroidales bacterium]|nr:Ig-like domain-containing protein [Bacteroidales bacterium]
MRKKYLLLALSAIMLLMVSCDKPAPAPIKVAGVSLNQTSVKLVEGDQVTLIATVTPSDAANKNVSWISS